MSGSLVFCSSCRRVVGYIVGGGNFKLKDARISFFVPIESGLNGDKQTVFFRVIDHGPTKRKCSTINLIDEPLNKKFKIDNTQSVIVMRMRAEIDEHSRALVRDDDDIEFIDYSSDEYMSASDLESESGSSGLDSYDSSTSTEFEFRTSYIPRTSSPIYVDSSPEQMQSPLWFHGYHGDIIRHDNFQVLSSPILLCEYFILWLYIYIMCENINKSACLFT